ncbi:MAG: tRNA (N(6)-L-threonylcarbamoyladenosine(37)-C(2))-methylthiotransferase [Candidatus Bathyarchaeota archaeon]
MIPKSKRIYVKNFGCSANLADGEFISGCLLQAGFNLVDKPQDAEILLYNTCAVKSPTENRIIDVLKKVSKDKLLVVTGCLPLVNFERLKNEVDFDAVTGPAPGVKIVDVMNQLDSGKRVISLASVLEPSLYLPRIPTNKVISIVPINYGCLGGCSYCCVRYARGRLRSSSIKNVLERIKKDLTNGAKEVWLTSQDSACYGKDIGTNLSDLIYQICKIKEDFFIRIGMMNPNQTIEILDELVEAFKNEKVFKFLHLPVQSGDDNILRLMNRHYTTEDFKKIINTFRHEFPKLTVSTDVICGFPGESKDAFNHTKDLITEIEPDIVNVSKFFPRPRTPAAKLEPISANEISRRSKEISNLTKKISFDKNKDWMKWEGKLLFDEKGKGKTLMGRNFAYKTIVVEANETMLGKLVKIRINKVCPTYLKGVIV